MIKTDLAQKIRMLAGLTDTERWDLLALLNEQKKYGLIWEEKPEQVEEDLRDKLPILREVTGRRITARRSQTCTVASSTSLFAPPNQLTIDLIDISTGPTDTVIPDANTNTSQNNKGVAPHHLLIEGDNLHALTVLNYTHAGKVDVIYIDPPYNTGNRDFKYNDRFVDREDSYRHSKWLSFMHKRLELARNLLKPEGVIFISIDDNEQAQLKLLCDRIIGDENFVATVIWEKNDSPKMDSKAFSARHDFILVYANHIEKSTIRQLAVDADGVAHYNKTDISGKKYYLKPLRAMGGQGETREARPTLYYPITAPDGTEIFPKRKDGSDGAWRWSKEKLSVESSRIEWTNSKNGGWAPNYKIFAENNDTRPPETIWTHQDAGSNRQAKIEMDDVLGKTNSFNTPKPTKLLKQILKISADKNALILDFFAGSGTTLHAVMSLNAEDELNGEPSSRQCILVTNNENNIAEEVCYERNRRVIEGYTNSKGVAVPGLTNNHLHYYQTTYVGRERTQTNKRALMQLATELLCIKDGCFNPIETPYRTASVDLSIRLFTNDPTTQYVVIIYEEDAIENAVTLIQGLALTVAPIKVYVFAPGSYPYTDDFEDVLDRVELCALPEAIYQAYGRLLPPQGEPKAVDTEADLSTEPQQMLLPLNV
ncbi:site-specific DNA-methyltransferase [Spirosoma areae]